MSGCGTPLENILYSGAYNFEGMKFRPTCELDPFFIRVWRGGFPKGTKLIIKAQLSEDDKGRLLYYGKLYNRDCWTWQPPKFIRLRGRTAKEQPNPFNNYPTRIIEVDNKKVRIRDSCRNCGGRLVYDTITMDLYCEDCFVVHE